MALLPMLALPKLALSVVVSMVVALPKLMQLTMTTLLRATILVLPCMTAQVSPLLDVWLVPPTSEPWLGQEFNIVQFHKHRKLRRDVHVTLTDMMVTICRDGSVLWMVTGWGC